MHYIYTLELSTISGSGEEMKKTSIRGCTEEFNKFL